MWVRVASVVLVVGLASCGSSSSLSSDAATDAPTPPGIDAPASVDAPLADDATPTPDAAPPGADATPGSATIGQHCPTDTECAPGLHCLDASTGWPASGYCTKGCTMDATCGPGAFCSPQDPLGGGGFCIATCGGCAAADRVCTSIVSGTAGATPLSQDGCLPGIPATPEGTACTNQFGCGPDQRCYTNPFDFPGGYCVTLGCTVGDDATCAAAGDGACVPPLAPDPVVIPLPATSFTTCLDGCTSPADCRTDEGYICDGGRCVIPHAAPGAACAADAQCGPPPWQCLTGPGFPGGYCAASTCDPGSGTGCPLGSQCLWDEEWCAAVCTSTADCRPGYTCTPTQPGYPDVCR
jgi:hypothetical protein